MKTFFSNNEKSYIIKEYLNTKKSVKQIANEFHCSTTPVTRVLKMNHIKIKRKNLHPILTESLVKELIKDYNMYQNIRILARKYNQTNTKVAKILKENNIKIINLYTIPKIEEKNWDEIVELYQAGNSLTQIAKKYKVDHHAIGRILKKRNIEVINRQNLPRMDETVFEKINNEKKAYWLGFIYADGYISKGEFGIALSIKDEKHILKLQKFFNYTGNIRYRTDNNSCSIVFRNKKVINDLKKLGVLERKSKIIQFPTSKQVPKKYIRHFIRGYIDGDGSVFYNKNGLARLSILGTESILNGIITTMNFKKLKMRKANKDGCEEVKSIEWTGEYVLGYIKSLYNHSTISLDRKKNKILEIKKFRKKRLKEMQLKKKCIKY